MNHKGIRSDLQNGRVCKCDGGGKFFETNGALLDSPQAQNGRGYIIAGKLNTNLVPTKHTFAKTRDCVGSFGVSRPGSGVADQPSARLSLIAAAITPRYSWQKSPWDT